MCSEGFWLLTQLRWFQRKSLLVNISQQKFSFSGSSIEGVIEQDFRWASAMGIQDKISCRDIQETCWSYHRYSNSTLRKQSFSWYLLWFIEINDNNLNFFRDISSALHLVCKQPYNLDPCHICLFAISVNRELGCC